MLSCPSGGVGKYDGRWQWCSCIEVRQLPMQQVSPLHDTSIIQSKGMVQVVSQVLSERCWRQSHPIYPTPPLWRQSHPIYPTPPLWRQSHPIYPTPPLSRGLCIWVYNSLMLWVQNSPMYTNKYTDIWIIYTSFPVSRRYFFW